MRKPEQVFEKVSAGLRLILAAAGGDTAGTEDLLRRPVDWEAFLRLAVYHQVCPLVYRALGQLAPVPAGVLAFLREKSRENGLRALKMAGETVKMVKCLEDRGVRVVVLKGAPLACRLYGDVTVRPSRDIDILVPPGQVEMVDAILGEEGYRKIRPELDLAYRKKQILTHLRELEYGHPEKDVLLEIHWNLGYDRQVLLPMPSDGNTARVTVAGSSVPVLADEYCLLYLILHGASHAWFRLRWLVDIGRFVQEEIDWEKVAFLAKGFGMEPIAHQGLILVNRLLAAPWPYPSPPDRRARRLACRAVFLSFAETGSSAHRRLVYDYQMRLGLRMGWQNRLNHILGLLGPSVHDIKLLSLPDNLFALYYVIRPFTLCYRYLAKNPNRELIS